MKKDKNDGMLEFVKGAILLLAMARNGCADNKPISTNTLLDYCAEHEADLLLELVDYCGEKQDDEEFDIDVFCKYVQNKYRGRRGLED